MCARVTVIPACASVSGRPQNLIAQSQSGTGKTAAFVLAMLSRVDITKNYPQVSRGADGIVFNAYLNHIFLVTLLFIFFLVFRGKTVLFRYFYQL